MTEYELHTLWAKARLHVILSQVAPIFLLIVTVALLETGLRDTPLSVRLATAGILLASGVLGVVAQFSAGNEAIAIADDLRSLGAGDAITARVVAERRFADIVRFVGPVIFVVIFLALLWALFVA